MSFFGRWSGRGSDASSLNRTYRQWLKIPLRGSLISPGVLAYNVTLSPSLSQNTSPGLPEALKSRTLGWSFDARLLSRHPVSLSLSAGSTSGVTAGGMGSEGDFSTMNFAGILNFRNRFIPASIAYTSRSGQNTWISTPGATPIGWSTRNRTLRFNANTATLNFWVRRILFDNLLSADDFATWDASLSHELTWGLGSRLRSAYSHFDRTGTAPYGRRVWTEQLAIRHSQRTFSALNFRHHTTTTTAGSSVNRSLSFNINSQITRWFSAGARAATRSTRFNGSSDKVHSGGPSAGMRFRLPLDLRVSANGSVGIERRARSRTLQVPGEALEERHAVDETRTFLLDQPDADASTVSITNADATVEYLIGLDYRLNELDGLVEVVVTPGSRIQVGDAVLVSYQYSLSRSASPSGTLLVGNYTLSVTRGGLGFRHARFFRGNRDLDGGELATQLLGTLDETRTNLQGSFATPLGLWRFDLLRRSRRSSSFDYATYEARTDVALPPLSRIQLYVGAAARHTEQDEQSLSARSAHLSFTWNLGRMARMYGKIEALFLDINSGATDRSIGGDLSIDMRIASIDAVVQVGHYRQAIPVLTTRSRLSMRIVRRF